MDRRRVTFWAALTGVLAAAVTLAIAEAFAAFMATPDASPLFAVGSAVIDLVPPWVKELVISLFGTGDKIALFVVLGTLVFVLAIVVGVLQYRRPPWGSVLLAAVGVVSVIAVASRAAVSAAGAGATLARHWLTPSQIRYSAPTVLTTLKANSDASSSEPTPAPAMANTSSSPSCRPNTVALAFFNP